uniref:Secreted protein n=1 Tax=Chromera velia CCMP2878 TaxID=1169474 RepID=A0A0G4GNU8_9ALVE|eukprot:Cvel_22709.t1-p1 / transcript=Cvel_22709.t1 / gene=Cvel_22709 / organism=Chromera_velia_CCMP2878 / gene_product=hypothetical protein / transcript_product=hypothetical protein / location=Cvel_scaffold2262:16285-16809(-) / protein_length=175 / sequence_SO=supercontig / SO=protein_coding / is_pseudo=false
MTKHLLSLFSVILLFACLSELAQALHHSTGRNREGDLQSNTQSDSDAAPTPCKCTWKCVRTLCSGSAGCTSTVKSTVSSTLAQDGKCYVGGSQKACSNTLWAPPYWGQNSYSSHVNDDPAGQYCVYKQDGGDGIPCSCSHQCNGQSITLQGTKPFSSASCQAFAPSDCGGPVVFC